MNTRASRSLARALFLLGALVLASTGPTVLAEPVDQTTAEGAAAAYIARRHAEWTGSVSTNPALTRTRSSIPQIALPAKAGSTPLTDPATGQTLGYVVRFNPVGYAVTSSDTDLLPVILFSFTSNFSFDEDPENLALHLARADLKQRLGARAKAPVSLLTGNHTRWSALVVGGAEVGAVDGGARPGAQIWGPWVDTQWAQGYPYNKYCPIDPITHNRCVTGCVATAFAQVINYWMYPSSIIFTAGDNYTASMDPNDGLGVRIIPIDATTASIPSINYCGDSLDPNQPTEDMIGRIMFACGVSVHMGYSSLLSGAGGPAFGRWGYASTYGASGAALANRMKAGQPGCAAISPLVGQWGHEIVIDGYWEPSNPAIEPNMYHTNFGPGNAWYAQDAFPGVWVWGGGASGGIPPAPAISPITPDPNTPMEGVPYAGPTPEITLATRSRPCTWALLDPDDSNIVLPFAPGDANLIGVDPNTGIILWMNPGPLGSTRTVKLRAGNEAGTGETTFQLTVRQARPVIDPNSLRDVTISAGQLYTGPTPGLIHGSQPITWSLVSGPAGMTIPDANTGVVSWPEPNGTGSPFTVTIKASNAAGDDTGSWKIWVDAIAPLIASISDHSTPAGVPYTYSPSLIQGTAPVEWSFANPNDANDPNEPNTWRGMAIDPNSGVVSWSNPGPEDSNRVVAIRAKNDFGQDIKSWRLYVTSTRVNRYAVLVGISDFQYINDLQYCDDDAISMRQALLSDPNWQASNIWLLVDSQATKAGVRSAIQAMAGRAGPNDVCLVFYSGHGSQVPDVPPMDEADGYDETLCPYDTDPYDANSQIRDDEFSAWIGALPAKNVVVMLDTCFSGGQIKAPLTPGFQPKTINLSGRPIQPGDGFAAHLLKGAGRKDLNNLDNLVVLTACDEWELSYELPTLQHGLFTYFLLQAIGDPSADTSGNGRLSGEEAFVYLYPKVVSYSYYGMSDLQHPQVYDGNGSKEADFVVSAGKAPLIAAMDNESIQAGVPYARTPILLQGSPPVLWSLTAGPNEMTLDPNNGRVTWGNPRPVDSSHVVTVRATNNFGSADATWTLRVVGTPPVIGPLPDGEVLFGRPYTGPTPSVTGTPPITWSLPDPNNTAAGMLADPNTGVVRWPSPGPAGSVNIVLLKAHNSAGDAIQSWRLRVIQEPNIVPIPDANIPAGVPYNGPLPSLATGTPPVLWTLADANNAAAGMTIDSNTGVVSWQNPGPVGGSCIVTIKAKNSAGEATTSWRLTVNPAPPAISEIPDANVPEGVPYTSPAPNLTAGTPPISWSLVEPNDPNVGIAIDAATGRVSWQNPVPVGNVRTITIQAHNSGGDATRSWRLTVVPAPPVIAAMADANVAVGQSYIGPAPVLIAGTPPVDWSFSSPNSIQPGMTIDPNSGVVSWPNPWPVGIVCTISVKARNSAGEDTKSWRLTVDPAAPVVAAIADAQITEGQAYTGPTPVLTAGTPPIIWSLPDANNVAAGMSIDANSGVVTWSKATPVGAYVITIRAANSVGMGERSWQLVVGPAAPSIAPIPDAQVAAGQAYTGPAPSVIGTAPIAWLLPDSNNVNAGMRINASTGVVSWPNPAPAPSVQIITIAARNSIGTATASWRLTVTALPPSIAPIPDGTVILGQPYIGPRPTVSGTAPITWSLLEPTDTNGIVIDPNTGVVSWTSPGPAGSIQTITINAHNAGGDANESWHLTVVELPVIADIPNATVIAGHPYSSPTPSLVRGTQPVTWSFADPNDPNRPAEISMDPNNGTVSWSNPTTAGSPFTLTIRATNTAGYADKSWHLAVTPPPVVPVISTIPDGTTTAGQAYTGPRPTVTGTPPIGWTLPDPNNANAGMTIDATTGVVTWANPTASGSPFRITIRAANAAGFADASWRLTVNPAPVAPTISSIPDAGVTAGQAYTGPTPAVTGTQPITWSLVAPPSGMTINSSTGVVTWSAPTTVGSPYTITIRATNIAGSADESWLLTVNPAPVPPVIGAIPDASATEGQSYIGPTPSLAQGSLPVTWSLVPPSVAGMTINAGTGVVSWSNPTSAGSPYTITIQAANAAGSGQRSWRLTVGKPVLPPVVNSVPDGQVTAGQTYTGPTPSLSQGSLPVTWSLVTFPSGMTIDSGTGVVTWPNAGSAGSQYTVRIRAENSAGSADASWLVTVNPAKAAVTLAISPADASLKFTVDGQEYTGTKTFTWDVGSVHALSVASPQSGSSGEKYLFDSWSDSVASASRSFSVSSQAAQNNLTASMSKILPTSLRITGSQRIPENQTAQYRLELTMSNGETQDVTTQGSWRLSSNQYAEIGGGGKLTTHEVQNDTGCEIIATYTQPSSTLTARLSVVIANVTNSYTLTVSTASPAGAGTPVHSTHPDGQIVPVAVPAAPGANMAFVRWIGDVAEADATANPLYVRMDGDKSVTAIFQTEGGAPCLVGAPTGLLAIGFLCLLGRSRSYRRSGKGPGK
jgi:hypothetical protein